MATDIQRLIREYEELKRNRQEWELEARSISRFLVQGRGIYSGNTKPAKRKLTTPEVVNPVGKESLGVLTANLQGYVTSPSRPWFDLSFRDTALNKHPFLSVWLYDCSKRLYHALAESNFYQAVHSFYREYAAFGTGVTYVGSDTDGPPFRFETLTFGEYCIATNSRGIIDRLYRTIYMNVHQLIDYFGKANLPKQIRERYEKKDQSLDFWYTVIEAVLPERFAPGMPFKQVFFILCNATSNSFGGVANGFIETNKYDEPLKVTGFHEFPYPAGRWDVIGSDEYGIGPGSEALPHIKRLQEVERAFLMAVHKGINPPLNVPSKLRDIVQTIPGGVNYYNDPSRVITPIYQVNFNFDGALAARQEIVSHIQKAFHNDVFLTAVRDPNASPLKATQVNVQEQEKMLRLGPVVERLQYEYLQQLLERCFNIMLRKGLFMEVPPELAEQVGEYDISLTSVLAQAQKAIAAGPIVEYLQILGAMQPFAPDVLDKLDTDKTADEFADIKGVPKPILRDEETVRAIRQQRQKAQAAEQQRQQQLQEQAVQAQSGQVDSQTALNYSKAGVNVNDALAEQVM